MISMYVLFLLFYCVLGQEPARSSDQCGRSGSLPHSPGHRVPPLYIWSEPRSTGVREELPHTDHTQSSEKYLIFSLTHTMETIYKTLSKNYSGTSDNRHSEKWTTSLTVHPLPISIFTSEEGTTSEHWRNTHPQCVHYSEVPL